MQENLATSNQKPPPRRSKINFFVSPGRGRRLDPLHPYSGTQENFRQIARDEGTELFFFLLHLHFEPGLLSSHMTPKFLRRAVVGMLI